MKKVMLTILLLLMVVLSACSLVENHMPNCLFSCNNSQENESDATGYVVIDNPFEFTDKEGNDVEVIDLNEDDVELVEEVSPDEDVVDEDSPAVLASINAVEGELISLANLLAQDPDGDVIVYTYSEPLSFEGLWQTNDGDEGEYIVTVTASDGLLSTSENIKVIVSPSNKGPVVDCPVSLNVLEGAVVELPCTIYDKEGDEVSFLVSGFANNLNFETSFDDAGDHEVIVSATDGTKTTTSVITLFVANVNRAPVVDSLLDISILEGEDVNLVVVANDADGDDLSITYPLLFDETGSWTTAKGDAGKYDLETVVSDGFEKVIVPVTIVVGKVNSAPTLLLTENIVVDEGEVVDLEIVASDIDGDDVQITFEGMMSSGTYQTTYEDAGEYDVIVTASDGKKDVSLTAHIVVNDVNRPPVFILR